MSKENTIKNYGKSIRTKLLNVAKKEDVFHQTILTRYFQERLLYRMSQTRYRNNFYLKGGALMYAYEKFAARPTLDIDFLGNNISNEGATIVAAFKEICSVPYEEDGVDFDIYNITAQNITEFKDYHGIRLSIPVKMDTISQVLTMDIGFGDVVSPYYPSLLPDVPSVNLKAYSIETVIAEKFHTMLDRDVFNSRRKDFFDCYQLFGTYKIDHDSLYQAINATFSNRKLEYNADRKLFTESFATDEERNMNWNRFLKQINFKQELPFPKVMDLLRDELLPMEDKYWHEHDGVKL